MMKQNRPGLTLFETLLSLVLFTGVILGGLDFFARTRRLFFRLSAGQDSSERAQSALDKMAIDALEAGKGLAEPIRLGLLQPIESSSSGLVFWSIDQSIPLPAEVEAGAVTLPVTASEGFSAGRDIGLIDRTRGELASIQSVDAGGIRLAAPTQGRYSAEETTLILFHRIEFPWNPAEGTLRRKVNAASAQPLLEDVAAFHCAYAAAANLVRIGLRLKENPENEYAVTIYPKNSALARAIRTP
jgi:hypothetical protein